jgi:hypothetical protein
MRPFPWGLLTLILAALDLLFTGLYLFRKRLARRICRMALAKGKRQKVATFLYLANLYRLVKQDELRAWCKEFGLEEL